MSNDYDVETLPPLQLDELRSTLENLLGETWPLELQAMQYQPGELETLTELISEELSTNGSALQGSSISHLQYLASKPAILEPDQTEAVSEDILSKVEFTKSGQKRFDKLNGQWQDLVKDALGTVVKKIESGNSDGLKRFSSDKFSVKVGNAGRIVFTLNENRPVIDQIFPTHTEYDKWFKSNGV